MNPRDIIFFCAFRYALGRTTYVVSEISAEICKNAAVLDDSTKRLIIKEITEAERDNGLGADFDKMEWIKTRSMLEKHL